MPVHLIKVSSRLSGQKHNFLTIRLQDLCCTGTDTPSSTQKTHNLSRHWGSTASTLLLLLCLAPTSPHSFLGPLFSSLTYLPGASSFYFFTFTHVSITCMSLMYNPEMIRHTLSIFAVPTQSLQRWSASSQCSAVKPPYSTLCCSPMTGKALERPATTMPPRDGTVSRLQGRFPRESTLDFRSLFVLKAADILLSTKAAMIHTAKGNIWFSIIFDMNSVLSPSDPLQTLAEPDCPPTTMPEASEQSHLGALRVLRQSVNQSGRKSCSTTTG